MLIAAAALIAFVGHVFGVLTVTVDSSSVYILAIAIAALVVPTLAELSIGKDGVTLKTRVDEIDRKQQGLQETQSDLKDQIARTKLDLSSHQQAIGKLVSETSDARAEFEKNMRQIDESVAEANGKIVDFRIRMTTAQQEFERIEQALRETKEIASALERDHLRSLPKESPKKHGRRTAQPATQADPDDPNKNQFGGSSSANGRTISAKVRRTTDPDWFRVRLRVESTDPQRPLADSVEIYLHPTFKTRKYKLKPKNGIATDEFYSYGAFTVGALTDGGATRLELDLSTVEDAPVDFRER